MKFIAIAFLVMAACAATVGTSGSVYVPKDSANTCSGYCSDMGLQLNSVVIMANNVGCVCSPAMPTPPGAPGAAPGAPGPAPTADAGGAGGMAALMMQRQAEHAAQSQAAQTH